jgi:hypothetical protein
VTFLAELLEASNTRALTFDDFGGLTAIAERLPTMVGHPLLVAVTEILDSHMTTSQARLPSDVAAALHEALRDTENPAIYRDAVDHVLGSPALLTALGTQLAESSLEQGGQPATDASPLEVLRAADALEVAVQLRLANWANRWDLFGCLDAYTGRSTDRPNDVYARAVLRGTVACIEQWDGTEDLIPVARRVAGLDPPTVGPRAEAQLWTIIPDARGEDGGVGDSDTGFALARIATLQALRSHDRNVTLGHLAAATRFLAPALAEDERPDVAVAADVATLLSNLITTGTIGDPDLVDRLSNNVRELVHLDPDRQHWVRDRAAASHTAWAQLARNLADAHEKLEKPSWYQAAAVIDGIVDLYRTTSSIRAYRRNADGVAVNTIIAPTLEQGFAAQASLLHHLDAHVTWLEDTVEQGHATEQQAEDLPVATALRDAAQERFENPPESRPKGTAGDPTGPTGTTPADTSTPEERVTAAVDLRCRSARFTLGNLVADELLERARDGFSKSPDYVGEVAEATDLITGLLIRFLWDRNQIGESEAPYLYDEDASEKDLANDLHQFLRGSGSLGSVTTEVRRVAGGRVDIKFGFPGYSLYVELKVDDTKVPVPDKKAYLGQAASYTVADQRVGFLVVLKLLPAKKALPPHLSDCLEVVEVIDTNGKPRHIAAITLSGARTKPSDM